MSEKIKCSYEGCERDAYKPREGDRMFCIFHSLIIDGKKEDFKKEWEKFLEQHKDDKGNFLKLDCRGFIFPIDIDFEKATFSQCPLFGLATFSDYAFFNNVTFSDGAYFDNVTFSRPASFENATFSKITEFDYATFSQYVCFDNATFSHAAYFNYTTFLNNAYFYYATFLGHTYFMNATFSHAAYFTKATFSQHANFLGSKFNNIGVFNDASFEGANLSNSSFTNCSFENVKYNIKPIKWEKPEKQWQIWKYHKLEKPIPPTDFTGIETSGILASSNRQFVRDIRDQQFINQMRDRIDSDKFFIRKWFNKIWFNVWGFTCDYGRSFFRLLLCCFVVAFIFGIAYSVKREEWFSDTKYWNWITPYYYSIVTFSSLGFGDIHPDLWSARGQIVVMIEVFFGYLGLGGLISIFANLIARRA